MGRLIRLPPPFFIPDGPWRAGIGWRARSFCVQKSRWLVSSLQRFFISLREMLWFLPFAMENELRPACEEDIPALEELILLSVHGLQQQWYSPGQRDAALGPVFGVDRQLIGDATYFVIAREGRLVASGGWSRRRSLFGGDAARQGKDEALLDPKRDAARLRAFFVHPHSARQGLGKWLLLTCEKAAMEAGFHKSELVATLAGEPLYAACGYTVVERWNLLLGNEQELPVVKMARDLPHSLLQTESYLLHPPC